MGRPTRDAAGSEERREEVVRNAEVAIDRARVEVDIRVEAPFLEDGALGGLGDRVPVRLAGALGELPRDALEDHGARVVGAVERMAEAVEPLAPTERFPNVARSAIRR